MLIRVETNAGVSEIELSDDKVAQGKNQVYAWMHAYNRNRWENQPIYAEVFIEKKAVQGIFQGVCDQNDIALGACKGYPSLTFLHETAKRFQDHFDKELVILYFGDYDPSGEDIPRSIGENLARMGVDVEIRRMALNLDQVRAWKLPHAPTKITDSRTANWDGIGQVELDAAIPRLKKLCQESIDSIFDYDLYDELLATESNEREQYQTELKDYINTL